MNYTLSIRENFEKREKNFMSPFGCKSADSRGRVVNESPSLIRTVFQVDRDRIVYSNAFRRLKHKTQVFLQPLGDDYRTRLTHTLEVAQIARTIARAMFLNEDLTEAIALGHDLGHTPFGHSGEAVLQEIFSKQFSHHSQGMRVVDVLISGKKSVTTRAVDRGMDGKSWRSGFREISVPPPSCAPLRPAVTGNPRSPSRPTWRRRRAAFWRWGCRWKGISSPRRRGRV